MRFKLSFQILLGLLFCNWHLTEGTWPGCWSTGADYSGDDVIAGLRFSEKECAQWCQNVGGRCVRWVYQQYATLCHLKAFDGTMRNTSDPLTAGDKVAYASQLAATTQTTTTGGATTIATTTTAAAPAGRKKRQASTTVATTAAAAAGVTTTTTTAAAGVTTTAAAAGVTTAATAGVTTAAAGPTTANSGLSLEDLIKLRVSQLEQTYSGLSSCAPNPDIYYPNCTQQGFNLDGADIGPVVLTAPQNEMEDCSLACAKDSSCQFWVYDFNTYNCTLKSAKGNPVATTSDIFYGSNKCVGRVLEPISPGEQPLDGSWSPWSTITTPCFSLSTGQLVSCGGGVQLRYRSCSEPHPRFEGKVCPGYDYDEQPCGTDDCQLPGDYLWSEWGSPPNCTKGSQIRTSMCGRLRRKLPNLPGRNVDDPPVEWPTCLKRVANTASQAEKQSFTATDMTDCFSKCKVETLDNCAYWSYNETDKECKFFSIFKASTDSSITDVVSGEKYCTGKLFYPYCSFKNQIYQNSIDASNLVDMGASITNPANMSLELCTQTCQASSMCEVWVYYVETFKCYFSSLAPSTLGPSPDSSVTVYTGDRTCLTPIPAPALPEDAQELSYIAVCKGQEYMEMNRTVDTWNITTCPSPCFYNGDCPHFAACIDLSTELAPNHTCVCTMGKAMVGGRCIDPPLTTPTPRPVATFAPAAKTTTDAVSNTSCFVLLGFVGATIILFTIFRIMDHGRFIHMNIEIALFCAHVCLLIGGAGDVVLCRNVSICLHFFFTVAFAFFMLEGVFIFSILGHIVPKDGMLGYFGNFMSGWGIGIVVIMYSISFEYESYGGEYSCWLDMSTGLVAAQYVPLVLMIIATVMLIEAAGSVDTNTMTPLQDEDPIQRVSAKYMHRTLFFRLGLCFTTFILGSLGQSEQNLGIIFVYTILNGTLGGVIFFSHCTCNEKIRALLSSLWRKMCGKKDDKVETDTEPLVSKRSSLSN